MTRRSTQLLQFFRKTIYSLLSYNTSSIAQSLRGYLYDTNCTIDTGVIISNPQHFTCGNGCALYHGTYILNGHGHMSMGHQSHLGAMCYVNVHHGSLKVGDDVAIGPHTDLIAYSNHYEHGKTVTDCRIQKDIQIGNNVFIGAHCSILPGAHIGENVVVGAGSVVKGDLERNAIYAGSPCKKIQEGWY